MLEEPVMHIVHHKADSVFYTRAIAAWKKNRGNRHRTLNDWDEFDVEQPG